MALLAVTLATRGEDAPWPMVHRDAARSGYSDEVIKGPYERKWFADFHDEVIATRVEAILAEGKVFVPTLAGRMDALDVRDGTQAWMVQTGGPIGASPIYVNERICFGSDDGRVYCVEAASGKAVWTYQAGASIWASPAVDGQRLFVGDRAGRMHAVDLHTGRRSWRLDTGYMILAAASVSERGTVVFASEDMHVYGVSASDGRLLWKSSKLGGLSARDHAPALWKGLAIVTTNPAVAFHKAPGENPAILTRAQKALPVEEDDSVIHDKWGGFSMRPTPRRVAAEQEAIVNLLRDQRAYQTFYAVDLETGKEPWIAGVLYTAGLHNPMTPPVFDPSSGTMYLWTASALSNYHVGVPGGAVTVATLDRATGRTSPVYHANGDKMGWAFDFVAPADETQSLSLMGNTLLNTHQGIIGGMRLDTLKWTRVNIARDTYGGIFGPAAIPGSFKGAEAAHASGQLALMANQWHGPDQGIVSIGYGRLFWVSGSQLICIGGQDVKRMESGGSKPPATIQRKRKPMTPGGNVANSLVGNFDTTVPLPRIAPEQVDRFLAIPALGSIDDPAVKARLAHAVQEVIAKEWSPLIVQMGISGEERFFWRTSQTMRILSTSLPHLPPELRQRVIAKLHAMWDQGMPLEKPVHPFTGHRREYYDLGPEMLAFARGDVKYTAGMEDLYSIWTYSHHADAAYRVNRRLPDVKRIVAAFLAQPVTFSHDDKDGDGAEHLNTQIAGLIGAHRLIAAEKPGDLSDGITRRLAELMALRVQHERADTRLVRSTRTASQKLHQARVPRYCAMSPEVGALLGGLAPEAIRRNLEGLAHDLPLWHHAWGERMIGGENYISPPHLSEGLFLSGAYSGVFPRKELLRRLDQPWCRADLMWIEKLIALLQRQD